MSNLNNTFTADEIIQAIDFFQDEFYGHPLTCGNDSTHALLRGKKEDEGVVYLACPTCDYIQTYIPDYVLAVWDTKETWKEGAEPR